MTKKEKKWMSAGEAKRLAGQKLNDLMQGTHDKEVVMMRMRMAPRWAEKQGCAVEDIDYTDPYVSLEYKLVDPAVRRTLKVGTPAEKDEIMQNWTEEEVRIYYYGDGDPSTSYRAQIEDGSFLKDVGKALITKVKRIRA